jgi:hypothetical protein
MNTYPSIYVSSAAFFPQGLWCVRCNSPVDTGKLQDLSQSGVLGGREQAETMQMWFRWMQLPLVTDALQKTGVPFQCYKNLGQRVHPWPCCGEQTKAYENRTQARRDAVNYFYLKAEIGTAIVHETGKGRTAASPKLCSEKQERKFLLLQCQNPHCGPTCLLL